MDGAGNVWKYQRRKEPVREGKADDNKRPKEGQMQRESV